jgi:primosomal protein N' (replication factor Y)
VPGRAEPPASRREGRLPGPEDRVVAVLPDIPAIDRPFDYLVPEVLSERVGVGTVVRIDLHGRRVRGWVVADDVRAGGRPLRPLAGVTGVGPGPEVLELADWAAWRWAGRRVHFLRSASPPRAVRALPPAPRTAPPPVVAEDGAVAEVARVALRLPRAVVRLPPAADALALVAEAARWGPCLVVAPSLSGASDVAARLRALGVGVALVPGEWAQAAAGARVVIGARAAAWAPVADLAAVVVLDEHDEAHQEEASPTWNAREVAGERAQRAGAACVWVSPCPSLEALAWAPLLGVSRAEERSGWPVVDIVDRRREEPMRAGLYSPRLVEMVRAAVAGHTPGEGPRAVLVLNRKGRAQLLVCATCDEPARCEACDSSVAAGDGSDLVCRRCGSRRPPLCLRCGAGRLKALRPGVTRVREDLERLLGLPVGEVSGAGAGQDELARFSAVVGTEAVLHRRSHPRVVAFLDLDAELLAPRYRAAEQALALVARAARLLAGGKAGGGRLVLQTRLPGHEVVQAALHADPARVARREVARREQLGFPPARALAVVSGPPAATFVEGLEGRSDLELLGPAQGQWLVRAPDHATLCDALAAVPRPPGRLRVAVDPARI